MTGFWDLGAPGCVSSSAVTAVLASSAVSIQCALLAFSSRVPWVFPRVCPSGTAQPLPPLMVWIKTVPQKFRDEAFFKVVGAWSAVLISEFIHR